MDKETADKITHLENTVYNLTLYLAYAVIRYPAVGGELNETFDGMPGFAPLALKEAP